MEKLATYKLPVAVKIQVELPKFMVDKIFKKS